MSILKYVGLDERRLDAAAQAGFNHSHLRFRNAEEAPEQSKIVGSTQHIGFGATAFGKWFRLYSIGTIVVVLMSGGLAGLDGPRVAANLPTPWAGATERVSVFAFMVWVVVLGACRR